MMLKTKTNRGAWLKALYIVPVVLTSLAMTAKTVVDDETVTTDDNRAVRIFNEKTNDRGDSYQIRHQPGVKFFRNGQEEPIPEGRSIALEVKKTTMQVNGKPIDQLSLLDLPLGALKEIHLTETGSDRYVCNLLTEKTIAYSANMSDMEFVIHVKQQQAAGIKQGDVTQSMLNEDGSISRARILHMNSAYGSKKSYLYVVDGKEVSREDYNRLKPEDFAAVTVMDVGPAKKAYGEKGRYGATIVETKQAVSENQQGQGDRVYDVCEQLPQFPGGDVKLMEFISRNIKYPEIATKNDVQGRVIVRFIVEKDGSLTNPEVLATSPGIGEAIPIEVTSYKTEKERRDAEDHNAGVQALRDEAIRVVKAMPKWIPGKQNGKVVRCKYSIPVTYRLN